MSAEDGLVLVTGATGYIACHVVQQLQRAGYRVRGTVRDPNNETKCQPLRELCPDATHQLELVEADLLQADTWPAAVSGCTYVIHTASPFPTEAPSDENELIKPAVDGTLNVLRAVKAEVGVRRVVLTSSCASIQGGIMGENGQTYTEENWTDPHKKGLDPYPKSKTLAEKAAWDFVNEITDGNKFELSVINPVLVMGPVLSSGDSTSVSILKRVLERQMPKLPHINFPMVDVRDVAAAHIAAMTKPEAAGKRHILYGGPNLWFGELAQILYDEFHPQGYNIPTTYAPYFILWILARCDKSLRGILDSVGQECFYDNTRLREVLQIQPHDVKDTLLDMSYSMIERGIVKKTNKYKGPPARETQNSV